MLRKEREKQTYPGRERVEGEVKCSNVCLLTCVRRQERGKRSQTGSRQGGGGSRRREQEEGAGGGSRRRAAAGGGMSEHRACCVDLIKFSSVLFAVGLVTQLYLYSAVCRVLTTHRHESPGEREAWD